MRDLTFLLKTDGVPVLRERGAGGSGGMPEPPPTPIEPTGGVGRAFGRPKGTARTYFDPRRADQNEDEADEDEVGMHVRGDEDAEDGEAEDPESEMYEAIEVAHTALGHLLKAWHRRRASGPEERRQPMYD